MSTQQLLELKGYGHQLLDVLAERRGWTKDQTYGWLASRLGVKKQHAHFGAMGPQETQEAVKVLRIELAKGKGRITWNEPSAKTLRRRERREKSQEAAKTMKGTLQRVGRINKFVSYFPRPLQKYARRFAEKHYA